MVYMCQAAFGKQTHIAHMLSSATRVHTHCSSLLHTSAICFLHLHKGIVIQNYKHIHVLLNQQTEETQGRTKKKHIKTASFWYGCWSFHYKCRIIFHVTYFLRNANNVLRELLTSQKKQNVFLLWRIKRLLEHFSRKVRAKIIIKIKNDDVDVVLSEKIL